MKKYEEEKYKFENIKDKIYPWVKEELVDSQALNGKHFSEKDAPVVVFLEEIKIIFVIRRGESVFEVLKDNMLPPECDIIDLYHTACENLARDVEFVIANTWYGAYGIVADGYHEASALCLKHIWQVCVEKLQDDLVIVAPCKDTILFAPAGKTEIVDKMIEHGQTSYDQSTERISMRPMLFSREGKELCVYED